MTPHEEVRGQFVFVDRFGREMDLRPYQVEKVNLAGVDARHALYWEPGSGKTFGATHWALYRRMIDGTRQWWINMPPILLEQWQQWLTSIRDRRTGEPLKALVYAGSPQVRKNLSFEQHDFILCSYGLFKNDYERIYTWFEGRKVGLLNDEATAIKNIESDNHGSNKDFAERRPYMPLTGTPLSKPMDAYAYIKLLTGKALYRNKRAFEKLHVEEFDAYDRPTAYKNLDLLGENMKVQSSRILRREVQAQLPPVIYSVIPYVLADRHIELYNRLAREKLVELESGGVIDANSAQKLRMTLQQIVVNWPYFGQDDSLRPAILDLIEEALEEIGQKKLVIVANFRRTNAYLLEKLKPYGAVAIYGDVNKSERQSALANFLHNDCCKAIILQPDSAGYGVDGLQHVCSEMLIAEAPSHATPFHQVVARLDRDGQLDPINCRIAVAQRTSQVRLFRNLLDNDQLVNTVQGGYQDLKDSVYGN
jgi:hypothetical protein